MKYEWRKKEKELYLPKNQPQVIDVPAFSFLTIKGEGSPDTPSFAKCIEALYTISYAIKMVPKTMSQKPKGYFDFTVFPLEGIWSLNEEAIKNFTGKIDKKDFVYQLMIRQPQYLDQPFFEAMVDVAKTKKNNAMLDNVNFETIHDGLCVQMMHLGSYDNEAQSFSLMEGFATQQNLERLSKIHREIYISDFRKVAPEKLKTVLRFKVKA